MHKAITSALRKQPERILCDVRLSKDIDMGKHLIEIQERGDPYIRYASQAELIRTKGKDHVAEDRVYRHIYFCDSNVPADVQVALSGGKS